MKRETILFLDSNVIISGLLSSKGSPRVLLDLLSLKVPHLIGFTGLYNLEEIERNLKKKFPQLLPLYKKYRSKINLKIVEIPTFNQIKPLLNKMPASDVPVLASAIQTKSDFLITGNIKDFPKKLAQPIRVVTPHEFLNDYFKDIVDCSKQ
ncbi:MAG: PIN domain-containing protein [Deltaproteobacteria bacterium]|nr:PIN domain-containing protein [Deltaproteobacteria bacterium]